MTTIDEIKEAIRKPWIFLYMDGRNEHGTHLLPVPPTGIYEEDSLIDDVLDPTDPNVEEIFTSAKLLGYPTGCTIVGGCRFIQCDEFVYLELTSVDDLLTRFIHGSPSEQVERLNQYESSRVTE